MPTSTLFTPDEFRAGRIENYINLPTMYNPDRNNIVQELMEQPVPEPTEILLHKAPTPPSGNAILGLASYPKFKDGWMKLVGSLRTNGYEGHIIVGVHPEIPQDERDYLDKMGGELCLRLILIRPTSVLIISLLFRISSHVLCRRDCQL